MKSLTENCGRIGDFLDFQRPRRQTVPRHRLGGDAGMASPLRKPKGMWRRTYERLVEEVFEAEINADDAFAQRAALMLARFDNRKSFRR